MVARHCRFSCRKRSSLCLSTFGSSVEKMGRAMKDLHLQALVLFVTVTCNCNMSFNQSKSLKIAYQGARIVVKVCQMQLSTDMRVTLSNDKVRQVTTTCSSACDMADLRMMHITDDEKSTCGMYPKASQRSKTGCLPYLRPVTNNNSALFGKASVN